MRSKTQDLRVELDLSDARKNRFKIHQLYEEFSQRSIDETIRTAREDFGRMNLQTRKQREMEVEQEIRSFRAWLEEAKFFKASIAHYCSIGLKSLLFGLPIGEHVSYCFGSILDRLIEE